MRYVFTMAKELEKVKRTIAKHRDELSGKFEVKEIGVFGSYARGEQKKSSDVDIVVRFGKPVGWEFLDLKEFLEHILKKKVDLVTFQALRPKMRDQILKEVVTV